jgi:NAD(P)-dependent dehydrogenase (short-subunit alcohol dehydrogenase family)
LIVAGAVVVGVGPGIGAALAARFARGGLPVALVARNVAKLEATAELVRAAGAPVVAFGADSTDEAALRRALDAAAADLGPPDVVVYNAALIRSDSLGELDLQGQLGSWAVNVGGALTTAAHVLPGMAEREKGTFLVTGGMPGPDPRYVSLSLSKAAVRALADLLDQQYGPRGVHVATVTVAGTVEPGGPFDPGEIAEEYWRLHTEPRERWRREVLYDPR